nr:hypothetical protein [Tanacetum cinerariifolium]
ECQKATEDDGVVRAGARIALAVCSTLASISAFCDEAVNYNDDKYSSGKGNGEFKGNTAKVTDSYEGARADEEENTHSCLQIGGAMRRGSRSVIQEPWFRGCGGLIQHQRPGMTPFQAHHKP